MTTPILDALIVGAGPTGLTLACELRRHGASCRVVEKLEAPQVWSKAAAVHARTVELLDDIGCAGDLLAHAKPMLGIRLHDGDELVGHVPLSHIESAFPHVYGASQRDTELVLARRLEELGGTIERGRELESFEQGDGSVIAKVKGGGSTETIEARYLVGCDGAHSAVRKICGFTFEGHAYEQHLIQADVHVDFPARGAGDEILAFLHADGPVAMFPLFKDGRYRVIVVLREDEPDVEPTLALFQKYVDARGPKDAVLRDPAWMVPFRIHCRRTDKYRDQRVLIAGDAAHIHSPAGGQGMNTGMQDAYNLGWKLALVARGRARESLLDSYEAERQPIAKALLAATDTATRGIAAARITNPLVLRFRNQLLGIVTSFGAVHERVGRNVSMLELNYRGSPAVGEDRPSVWGTNVAGGGETEAPSLLDWAAFGDGPAPGDRAPEVFFAEEGAAITRAGELFRGTKHTLLLFDGAASTAAGYANLAAIAKRMKTEFGDVVQTHIVVPYGERPAALDVEQGASSVVLDAEGLFHKRYGARSESLYLVRPDGYVGYRCQPADADKLVAYLDRLFRRKPADAAPADRSATLL